MIAKQTAVSASLVALLVGAPVSAFADPDDPDPVQPAGEVRPEQPPPPPPLVPRRRTGTFQIGAGFAPDESFIATARIAQSNLFGTGHQLALDARISSRRQELGASYDIPHLDGSALTLHTAMFATVHQLPGFTRAAAGGEAELRGPIGDNLNAFLGYRVQHVQTTIDELDLARSQDGGSRVDPDLLLASIRAGLVYSTLDQPFLPTKGVQLGASIEASDPRWGSDVRMTRFDSWGSVHVPVGPFIVHGGGSVSSITSPDPGGVPLSERLHFDGSSVLRGFRPGAIGPHDGALSLGGNFAYTARGELEVPLSRRLGISAEAFIDHAGIFDASGNGSTGTSVGFGLIWRSPIGPLRFDWAYPVGGDGKPAFVFGLGSSF